MPRYMIWCLRARYNRPKLIHQAHIKKIVDIPSLKDGSGKELRRLQDTAQQHVCALKALGNEPDGPFMKLDPTTLFEWQRHNQDSENISGYDRFLEFINLRTSGVDPLEPLLHLKHDLDGSSWAEPQVHSHSTSHTSVASYHTTTASGDDVLHIFWEIKENPKDCMNLFPEECMENHSCSETGRFVVLLSQTPHCK